ncbi:hypothetical protein PLICRDRAFT_53263 [Plicaturopsis crispa FD-325 SS-3]|nr:hypothetical protein PLICRDRAFT_53263 [Plicaturopsis crispa FD-325 SS-3]
MAPSNNVDGNNQHGPPILKQYPQLKSILQEYHNARMDQGTMVLRLVKEHQISMSIRSLQRCITHLSIQTPRKTGLSEEEFGIAIVQKLKEDPLGRWGYRKVQEKLALDGIHIPRDYIQNFMQARDKEAALARNPTSKQMHRKGLWSAGPNEEWGGDGHEKILEEMGISIWGLVDKASRLELGLWAVPSSRTPEVPVALYLLTVKKRKGIPIQLLTDKGSETGQVAALQTTLRLRYRPALDVDELPAHRFVKSVYNIVRERAWRPLFHTELQNILVAWKEGQLGAGYHPLDERHQDFAVWIWSQIVQLRLDLFVRERNAHKIRKQKNTYLPSGGSANDFYDFPGRWGGTDMLIPVDETEIDLLLAQHLPPRLFQFASEEGHALAELTFQKIGRPPLTVLTGWNVFRTMISAV